MVADLMVADLMVADLMVDDLMVGDLMVPPFRMRRQSPLSPLARLRRSGSDQLAGFAAVAATNLPASPQWQRPTCRLRRNTVTIRLPTSPL